MIKFTSKRFIIVLVTGLMLVSLLFTYLVGMREYNYAKSELVDKSRVMAQQIIATRHFLANSQDKINQDSKGNFEFKGLNPARGVFLIAEQFNTKQSYQIKQTTFPDMVRNRGNLPDEWELQSLESFRQSPGIKELFGEVRTGEGKFFRYAIPLYIDESCLGCHGGKTGETDIAGFKKEGYKAGELRGIVAIAVPMAGFDATFRRMIFSLLGSGIAMGALVSVGLALLAFYFVLKPAQKQLVEASQLAASGRIAADVVHEINNPLGIIISRAELILDEQDLPEQVEEDVRVIRQNAGRVAAYTKGLLSFARPFSGNPEKVDLNQVVQETLGFFSKQLGKRGISLSSELHPSGPRVWAQRAQLQQILLNLIGNARDALKDGGNICVRTGMANNHQIFLEVADTGCGIEREELGKIFDPFYSTKGECGTGLGLALCQSLVKENGGKITVASEPGIGSTFRVTLPGSFKDQA